MFIDFARLLNIDPQYVDECMAWAFGQNWNFLEVFGCHHVWNKRHRDIFKINGKDVVDDSYKRIGREFMDRKKKGLI